LVISPTAEDDDGFFRRVLNAGHWEVYHAGNALDARAALHRRRIDVVVVDCEIGDGSSWRDVLGEIQHLGGRQPVVMTSRLADDRLWAEVLNLGGYDLLMKPFDVTETIRVMTMAARRSVDRGAVATVASALRPAATLKYCRPVARLNLT
jgi:DNA-binding response OmpR family regulator